MRNQSSVCPRNSCAGGYGNCLDVKITNLCNGNCAFCIERGGYSPENQKGPVELALATVSQAEYQNVLILGGEPLMYPHLIEYLRLIRPYKKHIYLTTNGTLLDQRYVDLEKLGKYLDGINISIHHYLEEKNDMVLRGGMQDALAGKINLHLDFAALKKAIRILKMQNCSVRINCNLVKGYIDSYRAVGKMVAQAEFLHADELRFAELQNSPDEFVDAYTIFEGLPADPYTNGCEVDLKDFARGSSVVLTSIITSPMKIRLKLTCGRVNPLRAAVNDIPQRTGMTRVLYPNAQITSGWIGNTDGCHNVSGGCH